MSKQEIKAKIREAIERDPFKNNGMIIDAIVRNIEIVGEAANNVSKKFQKDNPEVPWRKVIGIRNHLIHEYFGVDKKLV